MGEPDPATHGITRMQSLHFPVVTFTQPIFVGAFCENRKLSSGKLRFGNSNHVGFADGHNFGRVPGFC
jgi:hypothetical protein